MIKIKSIIVVISLLLTTFVILPSVSADGNWTITVVDSAGYVGADSSIAVDSSNRPYISYFDSSNGLLRHARWTGSSWSFSIVGSAGDSYTSIKLDSSGNPHISYWSGDSTDNLMYASWTGSSWSVETVASAGDVGYQNCLALDSNNKPHIVYSDYTNPYYLKYAKKTGSSWEFSTVESGAVGCVSIDVDSSNYPHISYFGGSSTLKYAKWTGSSWSIQTVDSGTDAGVTNSIALDSSNHPHISYNTYSGYDLKYAEYTGSSWQYATVDSAGSVGMFNSIALDSSGQPRISYADSTNGNLKYAKRTGTTWSTEVVDSAPAIVECTGLAIDSSNNPHISYWDRTSGVKDLKYAKCVSTDPVLSVSTTTLNFGTHTQGWTGSSTFEIWNSGAGTLTYSLSEGTDWFTVSPNSGSSTGEHDTITVSVADTGGMSGTYSGSISVSSNGGSATITVNIEIQEGPNTAPYVPSNPHPGDHGTGVSVVYTLSWDGGDPNGDSVTYDLYINTCPEPDSFSPYIEDLTTDEYQIFLGVDLQYYWKVIATDEHGLSTPGPIWWFSTKTLSQVDPIDNARPNKPITPELLQDPLHLHTCHVGTPYMFTTTVSDPDGGKVNVYWDFDNDESVDFEVLNVTSGYECTIFYVWDKLPGDRVVRVIVTDPIGNCSLWSNPLTIHSLPKEGNHNPNVPSEPVGPSVGYKGEPYTYRSISIDPDGDDLTYEIHWGDSWLSEYIGPFESGETAYCSHTYDDVGTYNIEFRAKDTSGYTSSWSAHKTVSIIVKNGATTFDRDDFVGLASGDVFDNFPGQGRMLYANGTTGQIVTGAYAGIPFGDSWSAACQGVGITVGRQKTLTIEAEVSYISAVDYVLPAYTELRQMIGVDLNGNFDFDQEKSKWLNFNGNVEGMKEFLAAGIALAVKGAPASKIPLFELVKSTVWTSEYLEHLEWLAVRDYIATEWFSVSRMGNSAKTGYLAIWNKLQQTGGTMILEKTVPVKDVTTTTFVESMYAGQPVSFVGKMMLILQVFFEVWTLYQLLNNWQVDALLADFENNGKAETVTIRESFQFNGQLGGTPHDIWVGIKSHAWGAGIFFGFASAAGVVKSITVHGITAPEKPTLSYEEELHIGLNNFKVLGIDQNGDPIKYMIKWGDNTQDTIIDYTQCNQTVEVGHIYLIPKDYIIQIKTIDCDGMESPVNTYQLHVPLDLTQQQSQEQSTPSQQPTQPSIGQSTFLFDQLLSVITKSTVR